MAIDLTKVSRKNLNEIYKYVYECNKCGKNFGTDYKVKRIILRVCPICLKNGL